VAAIADHAAKVLADRPTGSAVPRAIQPDLSGSRRDVSRIYTSGTRPEDELVPRASADAGFLERGYFIEQSKRGIQDGQHLRCARALSKA